MAPGQEANGDNLGSFIDLLCSTGVLSVLIRLAYSNEYKHRTIS